MKIESLPPEILERSQKALEEGYDLFEEVNGLLNGHTHEAILVCIAAMLAMRWMRMGIDEARDITALYYLAQGLREDFSERLKETAN